MTSSAHIVEANITPKGAILRGEPQPLGGEIPRGIQTIGGRQFLPRLKSWVVAPLRGAWVETLPNRIMNSIDQGLLERAIDSIDTKAKALGLDFFETCFQIIDEELMAQLHAYILPVRFNHWSFGRDYERTKTKKRYGATALAYEMVINTDPAYAFLMNSNNLTEMKLVVAHAFGHVDFNKNNYLFSNTNRGIVGDCAINARKIYDYSMKYGWETVERWLDACIAISPQCEMARTIREGKAPWWQGGDATSPDRPRSFDIQDEFDFLFEQEKMKRLAEWEEDQKKPKPILEKDLLKFLMHNRFSDLEDWQKDVLAIVRDEWQYFVPNIQTQCCNEGWASYWHDRIITDLDVEQDFLTDENGDNWFLFYNALNANVLSPGRTGRINPYFVGNMIWKRIYDRWENPSGKDKTELKLPGGQGEEKMFEVRSTMNDALFIRNFLDAETVEELDLFAFEKAGKDWVIR
jgi:stage V sporulation protein R